MSGTQPSTCAHRRLNCRLHPDAHALTFAFVARIDPEDEPVDFIVIVNLERMRRTQDVKCADIHPNIIGASRGNPDHTAASPFKARIHAPAGQGRSSAAGQMHPDGDVAHQSFRDCRGIR